MSTRGRPTEIRRCICRLSRRSREARLLIDGGTDVNAANRYGVRPLSLAIDKRQPPHVELLLKSKPTVASPRLSLRLKPDLAVLLRFGRLGRRCGLLVAINDLRPFAFRRNSRCPHQPGNGFDGW